MCTGDRDQAWKNFRELYLGAKQSIFNQLVISKVSCTPANSRVYKTEPATADIYSWNHQPEFSDVATSTSQSSLQNYYKVGSPTQADNMKDTAQAALIVFYDQTCAAYVQQWAQQLSVCTLYNADTAGFSHLLSGLKSLCRQACDNNHHLAPARLLPGRASPSTGCPAPVSQDIINHYNQSMGSRMSCM